MTHLRSVEPDWTSLRCSPDRCLSLVNKEESGKCWGLLAAEAQFSCSSSWIIFQGLPGNIENPTWIIHFILSSALEVLIYKQRPYIKSWQRWHTCRHAVHAARWILSTFFPSIKLISVRWIQILRSSYSVCTILTPKSAIWPALLWC